MPQAYYSALGDLLWQYLTMYRPDFDKFLVQREAIFDRHFLISCFRDLEDSFHNVTCIFSIQREDGLDQCCQRIDTAQELDRI